MKRKEVALHFLIGAVGALTLGAVLAAVDFREADATKGQTQAIPKGQTQAIPKGERKVDKQLPAGQKVAPKSNMSDKSIKAGDGSVKQ